MITTNLNFIIITSSPSFLSCLKLDWFSPLASLRLDNRQVSEHLMSFALPWLDAPLNSYNYYNWLHKTFNNHNHNNNNRWNDIDETTWIMSICRQQERQAMTCLHLYIYISTWSPICPQELNAGDLKNGSCARSNSIQSKLRDVYRNVSKEDGQLFRNCLSSCQLPPHCHYTISSSLRW